MARVCGFWIKFLFTLNIPQTLTTNQFSINCLVTAAVSVVFNYICKSTFRVSFSNTPWISEAGREHNIKQHTLKGQRVISHYIKIIYCLWLGKPCFAGAAVSHLFLAYDTISCRCSVDTLFGKVAFNIKVMISFASAKLTVGRLKYI